MRIKSPETLARELQESFEKHGPAAIRRAARRNPQSFLAVVTAVLPKRLIKGVLRRKAEASKRKILEREQPRLVELQFKWLPKDLGVPKQK